jgi:hypothetical protein
VDNFVEKLGIVTVDKWIKNQNLILDIHSEGFVHALCTGLST